LLNLGYLSLLCLTKDRESLSLISLIKVLELRAFHLLMDRNPSDCRCSNSFHPDAQITCPCRLVHNADDLLRDLSIRLAYHYDRNRNHCSPKISEKSIPLLIITSGKGICRLFWIRFLAYLCPQEECIVQTSGVVLFNDKHEILIIIFLIEDVCIDRKPQLDEETIYKSIKSWLTFWQNCIIAL
jgi:hypothetical protein